MIFLLKSNFPASQDPETRLTPWLSFPAVLHAHQHTLGLWGLAQNHEEHVAWPGCRPGKETRASRAVPSQRLPPPPPSPPHHPSTNPFTLIKWLQPSRGFAKRAKSRLPAPSLSPPSAHPLMLSPDPITRHHSRAPRRGHHLPGLRAGRGAGVWQQPMYSHPHTSPALLPSSRTVNRQGQLTH